MIISIKQHKLPLSFTHPPISTSPTPSIQFPMGEAQWFFTWDEFLEFPPSLKNFGISNEIENRRIGTEFINKLGHSLGL